MNRRLAHLVATMTVATSALAAAPTADCAPRPRGTALSTACCCVPAEFPATSCATSCAMSCGSTAAPEALAATSPTPKLDTHPPLWVRATALPISPTPAISVAQGVARSPHVPLKRYLLACVLRL